MEFYLPNELLFQIIIKLPVKSLVRFMCVSKFWYSRISKSKFILSHLHHNQISGNYNVLFRKYLLNSERESYSLHCDNQQFLEIETLDFPFKYSANYYSIVGCVNGLICLWDDKSSTLILWNPSIRKYLILPKCNLEPPVKISRKMRRRWQADVIRNVCFGFGYDALSNDYKVVRIIFYKERYDRSDRDYESYVSVFSLRRRSWRRVDYDASLFMYSGLCSVGSFVYRLMTVIGNNRLVVVSFDLSAEVFTEIECPEEIVFSMHCTTKLTNFRDSLALLHEHVWDRYHLWVMREDSGAKSWTKLFSVDLEGSVPDQHIVGFSMKGSMLVVGKGSLLVSPVTEDAQVVKYVPDVPQCAWHVESYQESLVLLKEGDSLPLLPPNMTTTSGKNSQSIDRLLRILAGLD